MRYLMYGLLLSCVSLVHADIIFGDKHSSIIIEEGSTFVVGSDFSISGTIVNNGTLTVNEAAQFDITNGTLIDHGGHIHVYNHDATLYRDMDLSPLSTLTVASLDEGGGTIVLTGTGQKIRFSEAGANQFIIGDNTTVILRCVELQGYHDGAISFGENATLQFQASSLALSSDVWSFDSTFTFSQHPTFTDTPSFIYGNGKSFRFNGGVFILAALASLTIENCIFDSLAGTVFNFDSQSSLTLCDCRLQLVSDAFFNSGALYIQNTVDITGTGAFVYSSGEPIHLNAFSTLRIKDAALSYQTEAETAFISGLGFGRTARILLDDATLFSSVPTLFLHNLKLISTGDSWLSSLPIGDTQGNISLGNGDYPCYNSELHCDTGMLSLSNVVLNVLDC